MPFPRPDGDLYIAQIAVNDEAEIEDVPNGWTKITERENDEDVSLLTYWKIGNSEPASYTWEFDDDDGSMIGAIHRISGIETSTPNPINASNDAEGSNKFPTSPSVTTTFDTCMILRIYAARSDARISDYWPSGTTPIFQDRAGGVVSGAAYEIRGSAGNTGNGKFSMSGNKEWVAATIAIRVVASTPIIP